MTFTTTAGSADTSTAVNADPRVTVVIPSFNSGAYIGETLRSVLGQTYRNLEIIVVDDGSSDDTCQVVEATSPRIRLIRQANQGAAVARNAGVAAASGELIAFVDADDVWLEDKLRRQVDALAGSEYGLCYARFVRWPVQADGTFAPASQVFASPPAGDLHEGPMKSGWIYVDLLGDCSVWTSTVLVQREALLKVGGFDARLRKGQDYDLWLRLAQEIRMRGLDEPLALYRLHGGNITSTVREENFEYDILTRNLARFGYAGKDGREVDRKMIAGRLQRSCVNHGIAHFRNRTFGTASRAFRAALTHGARDPRVVAYWLLSAARAMLSA